MNAIAFWGGLALVILTAALMTADAAHGGLSLGRAGLGCAFFAVGTVSMLAAGE